MARYHPPEPKQSYNLKSFRFRPASEVVFWQLALASALLWEPCRESRQMHQTPPFSTENVRGPGEHVCAHVCVTLEHAASAQHL